MVRSDNYTGDGPALQDLAAQRKSARELVLARRRRGWSQRELARRAGVAHSTVSQLESGARKAGALETWMKLGAALERKS